MRIGPHRLTSNVIAAPMAGVTDRPFRELCRAWGAGLAVSEMVSSKPELRKTRKTLQRSNHFGESKPISVQIAGADPRIMADAARYNVERGAEIIDINMGCPAKKVCNNFAGSALLEDESQVTRILDAVIRAVDVPVTLKIRTGPDPSRRNGVRIAKIAESVGVQAVAVHGRTRACKFKGIAEYDTIRAIKQEVSIPVIANGDINTPAKAARVVRYTGADAVMVGRAAQGAPWLLGRIGYFLRTGDELGPPSWDVQRDTLLKHLENLYRFYGECTGVRVARKHIGWYLKNYRGGEELWRKVSRVDNSRVQHELVRRFLRRPLVRG